ncbi:MAG: cation:proton antiporter [Qingshengfaniella sp.]
MTILVIFLILIFSYSLISAVVERTRLTAPIVFTAVGIGVGSFATNLQSYAIDTETFLSVAELGLVLLLFTDGGRISMRFGGGLRSVPARLLSIGMVLTIALGLLAALVLFGSLSIWEAGVLAAILAPTDAGLGQAIVSDRRVPRHIRESLNVEAGLNDGLSVPFLLFFIALAENAEGVDVQLSHYFVAQFGYGLAIGLAVGWAGSRLFAAAIHRDWIGPAYRHMAVAALPMMCVLASEAVGASMFIAAFIAGLAARDGLGQSHVTHHSSEFAEEWGELINLTVFFLFGLVVAVQWDDLAPVHFLYALLSLTVVRMLPVAIALIGTGLRRSTVLFMGWFGPRGLASIVLGLVYLEHSADQASVTIRAAVIATVLVSILAHGLSAKSGVQHYAGKVDKMPQDAVEKIG